MAVEKPLVLRAAIVLKNHCCPQDIFLYNLSSCSVKLEGVSFRHLSGE
jgi:hypothetical protein